MIATRLHPLLDPATRLYWASLVTALLLALLIAGWGEPIALLPLLLALATIDFTRTQKVAFRPLTDLIRKAPTFEEADGQLSLFVPGADAAKSVPTSDARPRQKTTPRLKAFQSRPAEPLPLLEIARAASNRDRPNVITSAWLWQAGRDESLQPYLAQCLRQAEHQPSSLHAIRAALEIIEFLRAADMGDFESKEALFDAVAAQASRGADVVKKVAQGNYPPLQSRLAAIDPKTLKLRQIPG